jgi:hypothetical protein
MICEVKKIGSEYFVQAPDGFVFIDMHGNWSEDIQLIETEKV